MAEAAEQVYYDTRHPAAFGGVDRLQRAVKQKKEAQAWLSGQRVYTLHKPARKRFNTRRYKVAGLHMLWQADLVEMIPYADENDGYNYLLTVIDVFSRYAWARPLKRKTGAAVTEAFQDIFQQNGIIPSKLQTDQGKEFENAIFQSFLRQHRIAFFTIKSQFKAALVERFNRTLKEKMWRYFTHVGNYRWLGVLQDFIYGYNNAKHRSIEMSPSEVNDKNAYDLWLKQEGLAPAQVTLRNPRLPELNVGDYVRLSKAKQVFAKGYLPSWTEEIFQVAAVLDNFQPVQYAVNDYGGNIIQGSFYRAELQKVKKPDTYMIEAILRERKKSGGRMQYLVKWLGYGSEHNTWEYLDKQTVNIIKQRQRG
jgi:transposase InsO family protein